MLFRSGGLRLRGGGSASMLQLLLILIGLASLSSVAGLCPVPASGVMEC